MVSRELSRTSQETAHGGNTNTKDNVLEPDATPTIGANTKDLPRNKSFSFQPARWGRNVLQDIKGPLRRYKIRQGKQPLIEDGPEDQHRQTEMMPRPPRLSKHELEIAFSQPSSSQHLECLNLRGGDGPPKYRSERTLDRLEELDRELTRLHRQRVLIEMEKEELLSRVDESDDEQGIFIKSKKKKKNGKITAFKTSS
jgi:hypothetical protein